MAKFYSNGNFPLPVVIELRPLGHNVLTSLDGGQANQKIPDDRVVAFAHGCRQGGADIESSAFRPRTPPLVHSCGHRDVTVDLDFAALARRIDSGVAGFINTDFTVS